MKIDRRKVRPYMNHNYGWTDKAWYRFWNRYMKGLKTPRSKPWGVNKPYKGALLQKMREHRKRIDNILPF